MAHIYSITKNPKFQKSYYVFDKDNAQKRVKYIYKYMDMNSAIINLINQSIRFVQPSVWEDLFERRFYNADFSNVCSNSLNVTPKFYACCFTRNQTSEAAWKTYNIGKSGLGSRTIQFKIDRELFRHELEKEAVSQGFSIYEGFINYSYTDSEIESFHKKTSPYYNVFFNPNFNLENYFSLLLIKRQMFYHEGEFRVFMIPDKKVNMSDICDFTIDWTKFVLDIIVENDCTDIELGIFKEQLLKSGFSEKIVNTVHAANLFIGTSKQPKSIIIEK